MLIGAPFPGQVVVCFLTECGYVPSINLVIVDHFPVGVSYRGPQLQTLKLFGRVESGTTRRGVLKKAVGPCPLDQLLGLSNGSPARTRGTDRLTMLGAPFMTFMHHDLQE
jgi:hypothetical protein